MQLLLRQKHLLPSETPRGIQLPLQKGRSLPYALCLICQPGRKPKSSEGIWNGIRCLCFGSRPHLYWVAQQDKGLIPSWRASWLETAFCLQKIWILCFLSLTTIINNFMTSSFILNRYW